MECEGVPTNEAESAEKCDAISTGKFSVMVDDLQGKMVALMKDREVAKAIKCHDARIQQKMADELLELKITQETHREEIHKLEAEMLTTRLEYENKMSQNGDRERASMEIQIYKKESELAKERLRLKAVEVMKLNEKLQEAERQLKYKSNYEGRAARTIEALKSRIGEVEAGLRQVNDNMNQIRATVNGFVQAVHVANQKLVAKQGHQEKLEKEIEALEDINRTLMDKLVELGENDSRLRRDSSLNERTRVLEAEISRLRDKLGNADTIEANLMQELDLAEEALRAFQAKASSD